MLNKNISNINKWKILSFNINAFTLVEILISTFISIIVLSFIFLFLSSTMNSIWSNKNEIDWLASFYDFTNKINNLRDIYSSWWILVETSTGSDVFLMQDISWENWILIWPVKISSNQLLIDNSIYENKWIWFRKVSSDELIDINSNVDIIYDYIFHDDQIFSDIKIQDFILVWYNSWTIFDLSIIFDLDFKDTLVWQPWINLPRDSLKRFNINF